jgi:hypothetical protein
MCYELANYYQLMDSNMPLEANKPFMYSTPFCDDIFYPRHREKCQKHFASLLGADPLITKKNLFSTTVTSLFVYDPAALADLMLTTCVLPPLPATFNGFRSLTVLDLDYVIFSREKAWEWLEAMISAAAPTLDKLPLANIAFHHVAPGEGLPVLRGPSCP